MRRLSASPFASWGEEMENLNILWAVLGLVVLVLGPAGGVWAGIKGSVRRLDAQFTTFIGEMKTDREETRDWLKSLQEETSRNTTDIARLDERTKMGGA